MTLVQTIQQRATEYPDRPAIITADGVVTPYADLAAVLPQAAEYEHTTSGTTGEPKRIVITDDNLQRRLRRLPLVRGSGFAALTKLFAPLGLSPLGVQLRMHIWLKGGTIFAGGNEPDYSRWLDMCEEHQVEGCVFIPKLAGFLRHVEVGHRYRFPHVFVSGSAATKSQMRLILSALGKELYVNYAASEVGQIAGGPYTGLVADIPGCVGRIADDMTVEIEGGQLRIRCDTMVDGYVDDPVLTAERFKDGWFYPGDLGHFERGMLVIDGRA